MHRRINVRRMNLRKVFADRPTDEDKDERFFDFKIFRMDWCGQGCTPPFPLLS